MTRILMVLGVYSDMAERAEKEGTGKSLIPSYFPFNKEGDAVLGKYVANRTLKGENEGTYLQYTFETDDGMVEFHCGAYFDGHAGNLMKIGGVYHVRFIGKEKLGKGKNVVNKFTCVEIAAPMGK